MSEANQMGIEILYESSPFHRHCNKTLSKRKNIDVNNQICKITMSMLKNKILYKKTKQIHLITMQKLIKKQKFLT